MNVGIKDVAKWAGVSTATVSRVLANKSYVRQETRNKVFKAVEELGYRPSRVAQSLRSKRSRIIGLIISDIQNPFFISMVRAVEDLAYDNKYAIFLCNSDEDIEKERLYIDLMLEENVAGVIITPTNEINNPCKSLVQAHVSVVSVDRRMMDINADTVVVNNKHATTLLVEHLIKHGHKRIGAIIGKSNITTGRERYEGYLTSLQRNDISPDEGLIYQGLPKEGFGYEATMRLLELPRPPTAIFTGNNLLTIGCLKAIKEKNLRIPEDIALVAFDSPNWSSLLKPALTVINQPVYQLGYKACELIMARLADPNRGIKEIILDAELCIRESCGEHSV